MNSYPIELRASWDKDASTYQYRTYVSSEREDPRGARTVVMTFDDESSFRQRVNAALSHGQGATTAPALPNVIAFLPSIR
jgi:hypothetical protein